MSNTKTNIKKRNWAFVLYPESAPTDWLEQLKISGLQCAISPLHDKDFDATGEPKKPHYHIILVYGNPTTYNNVKALTDRLGQPIPQSLEQVRGYYRYLTHLDNPDKYQYNDEIIKINGFSITDFVELTRNERNLLKEQVFDIIDKNNIIEMTQLVRYVRGNNELNDIVYTNTLLFNAYITSLRYQLTGNRRIDTATGEIIG